MQPLLSRSYSRLGPLHATQRLQRPGIRLLSLSSVTGALNPPLDDRTLPKYFESQLLPSFADRPALICRAEKRNIYGGRDQRHEGRHLRWTFGEFDEHIEALARGLNRMGVKKGDRVGVVMGNNRFIWPLSWNLQVLSVLSSAYATLQWACARIGAILVTINPSYRAHELVRPSQWSISLYDTNIITGISPQPGRSVKSHHSSSYQDLQLCTDATVPCPELGTRTSWPGP
jgi:hypothetical protein